MRTIFIFLVLAQLLASICSAEDSSDKQKKHTEKIKELMKLPRTTFKDKAIVCKKLGLYYLEHVKEYGEYSISGGYTPNVKIKVPIGLSLPGIGYTKDDENELIHECHFVEDTMSTAIISRGQKIDNGPVGCDECGIFGKTALYLNINQKLDDKLFAGDFFRMITGTNVRNTFLPDRRVAIRSDNNPKEGKTYLWAVYGGQDKFVKFNGFETNVPVLQEIGYDAVGAIFARMREYRNYVYNTQKKKDAACIYYRQKDLGTSFFRVACIEKSSKPKSATEFDYFIQ